MGLGALFLLAFAGGLAGLYSLRPALITPEGVVERLRRLKTGVVAMAAVAWLTVTIRRATRWAQGRPNRPAGHEPSPSYEPGGGV